MKNPLWPQHVNHLWPQLLLLLLLLLLLPQPQLDLSAAP